MKKYGLLLSGGIHQKCNYSRYANDLGLAYETLINALGYPQKNIAVFYANGETINYLDHMIPTQNATLKNLEKAFSHYKKELTLNDEFFFVVSNHGGKEKNGIIYLWEKEYISLDNITNYLNQLPCKKIVILGQCYAGNIFERNHQNTIMISANQKDLPSYGMYDTINIIRNSKAFTCTYDEFLYHFFSYLQNTHLEDAHSSTIPNPEKVKDAFAYAYKHDRYNPSHADYYHLSKRISIKISEIPQYKEYR